LLQLFNAGFRREIRRRDSTGNIGRQNMHPGDTYIRASSLIGFVEFVESVGGDPLALLDEAKIPRSALQHVDALISYRALSLLIEIASQRLNKPTFGLEWSQASGHDHVNHGPLLVLGKLASTFGEWIALAVKYWRFHTNAFTMKLTVNTATKTATIRYSGDAFVTPGRQIIELIMLNIMHIARDVTGTTDTRPSLVRFQHSRPRDSTTHEKAFGCPVEFDCEHTEAEFDAAILDLKTSGNLRLLKTIVGSYIKFRISRLPVYDASMSTTVALAIPSIIGTGHCGIELIAESLGMHTKRLQRALADEGTNFSQILEKVRDSMARQLLIESDMSIERIAGLLDYSSTPPFTLAFKRWTGQTPLAFRKRERARLGKPTGPETSHETGDDD
jgi:AraC-like DNA-binding protein